MTEARNKIKKKRIVRSSFVGGREFGIFCVPLFLEVTADGKTSRELVSPTSQQSAKRRHCRTSEYLYIIYGNGLLPLPFIVVLSHRSKPSLTLAH